MHRPCVLCAHAWHNVKRNTKTKGERNMLRTYATKWVGISVEVEDYEGKTYYTVSTENGDQFCFDHHPSAEVIDEIAAQYE